MAAKQIKIEETVLSNRCQCDDCMLYLVRLTLAHTTPFTVYADLYEGGRCVDRKAMTKHETLEAARKDFACKLERALCGGWMRAC